MALQQSNQRGRFIPLEVRTTLSAGTTLFPSWNRNFLARPGGKLYKDDFRSVANSNDPASIYSAGFLNENWAAAEFQVGDTLSGLQKLADSEKEYRALPLSNINRFLALQRVRQSRSRLIQTSKEGQTLAERMSGQWTVKSGGLDAAPRTGTLIMTLDRDSGLLSASLLLKPMGLDAFAKIQENGPVLIQDLHTAIFTWQGSDPLLGLIAGTTTLTFDDSLTNVTAVEQQSNQSITKYTLFKPIIPPQ